MTAPRALEANNAIVASDLVVDYDTDAGTVRALDCRRFEVAAGTSVAVMGASGCGKSTLLGLLAGLATPTRGKVVIGDTPISTLPERERIRFRRRALGMVYQADNLLPHLTVEENVGLQLSICRDRSAPTAAGRNQAVGDVLNRLGIGELAARLPDQLSGGQRQRAAVARSIITGPQVVLADEPTGALDAVSAAAVIGLLVQVHREIGATLVVVTHDPAIAAHLDRVVQLARPLPVMEAARAQ